MCARFTPAAIEEHGPDMRPHATKLFKVAEGALNRELFRPPVVLSSLRDSDPPRDEDGWVKVEYENMYCPLYLFPEKKTYVAIKNDMALGLPLRNADGGYSLKVAGGQGKKRNNAPIVGKMEKDYIDALVRSDDLGAEATAARLKEVTRRWTRQVALDLLPWSDYVASTKLTKDAAEYDTENVATTLIRRMNARDPARHIPVGDRVAYLVVEPPPGEKAKCKRDVVEEVAEVVRRDLQVDCDHVLAKVVRGTAHRFLAVAGMSAAAADRFVEGCKRSEHAPAARAAPKKTTTKQLRGAPARLGGLCLTRTPSCALCRRPSSAGLACAACAATEAGAAVLAEAAARRARLEEAHAEFGRTCRSCRHTNAEAAGRSTEPRDIEEAVAGCENVECSVWVSRHWARRRLARESRG